MKDSKLNEFAVFSCGSGKTTLLKMLLGFYKPVEGEIDLGGLSLSRYSESYWRHKCGVVMQEGYIFSDTIGNNIVIIGERSLLCQSAYHRLPNHKSVGHISTVLSILLSNSKKRHSMEYGASGGISN